MNTKMDMVSGVEVPQKDTEKIDKEDQISNPLLKFKLQNIDSTHLLFRVYHMDESFRCQKKPQEYFAPNNASVKSYLKPKISVDGSDHLEINLCGVHRDKDAHLSVLSLENYDKKNFPSIKMNLFMNRVLDTLVEWGKYMKRNYNSEKKEFKDLGNFDFEIYYKNNPQKVLLKYHLEPVRYDYVLFHIYHMDERFLKSTYEAKNGIGIASTIEPILFHDSIHLWGTYKSTNDKVMLTAFPNRDIKIELIQEALWDWATNCEEFNGKEQTAILRNEGNSVYSIY